MRRNPVLAALLSLIVPGLGQVYLGHSERGAAILAAAIVIGNLNILFLLGFFEASPDPATIWAYWIPRIVHDVIRNRPFTPGRIHDAIRQVAPDITAAGGVRGCEALRLIGSVRPTGSAVVIL